MAILTREDMYTNGVPCTVSLFYETRRMGYEHLVKFSFRENDKGLINISDIYREYCDNDPTEYDFAIHVFGEWEIWEKICSAPSVAPYVEKLRKENQIRQKSKAMKQIMLQSLDGKYSASKFLFDNNITSKKPTKAEKKAETGKVVSMVKDDAIRLGIPIND